MIISASRRTDIPAFFAEWFLNRLLEGYVLVRNPMNCHQVSRIMLNRETVDAFVFWTKNPRPFFSVLDYLDETGYPYYFQYTLNDYPLAAEPSLPPLLERIDTIRRLSDRIGPDRIMWRYDPILLMPDFNEETNLIHFSKLCAALEGAVTECSFKFVVDYVKTKRNTKPLNLRYPDQPLKNALVSQMALITQQHGISLQGCCEDDYREFGVCPAVCISRERMEQISGRSLTARKDTGQRPDCRCIQSVEIGTYDTCLHGCRYCYANNSLKQIKANLNGFDSRSPILGLPLQEKRPDNRQDNPLKFRAAVERFHLRLNEK